MPNVVFMTQYYKPNTVRELTDENFKDKVKKRAFYSSNSRNDYVAYIDNGTTTDRGYDYIAYAGEGHEKTSGLFNSKGLVSKEEKKQIRKELRETKSVIFDGVISFNQEFIEDKIHSYKDCILVLNTILPKFFKENGLDENNVTWVAGLHQNTDNLHMHLLWYEKLPTHKRANKDGLHYHNGNLTQHSIDSFKVRCEEYLTGNKYFMETYRRNLMDGTINTLEMLQGRNRNEKKVKAKLSELYKVMPKGKVGYNSLEFAPYRDLVDEIGETLIELNPMLKNTYFSLKKDLKRHDDDLTRICKSQNLDADKYLLKDKYMEDFRKRIGNQIIKYAKKYEFETKYEDKNKAEQEKIRRKEKRYRQNLLRSTANLTKAVETESEIVFMQYQSLMKRAERLRLEIDGGIETE